MVFFILFFKSVCQRTLFHFSTNLALTVTCLEMCRCSGTAQISLYQLVLTSFQFTPHSASLHGPLTWPVCWNQCHSFYLTEILRLIFKCYFSVLSDYLMSQFECDWVKMSHILGVVSEHVANYKCYVKGTGDRVSRKRRAISSIIRSF